jgi:hypothetical protein
VRIQFLLSLSLSRFRIWINILPKKLRLPCPAKSVTVFRLFSTVPLYRTDLDKILSGPQIFERSSNKEFYKNQSTSSRFKRLHIKNYTFLIWERLYVDVLIFSRRHVFQTLCFSNKYLDRSARCARRDTCAVVCHAKYPRPMPGINQKWNVLTPALDVTNNRSALFAFRSFYLYTDRQTWQIFFCKCTKNQLRNDGACVGRNNHSLLQSGVQD